MIALRRLNGSEVMINAELIETVESTPDTVISLSTGNRYVVKEPMKVVLEKILEYRRSIAAAKKDPAAKAEGAAGTP